MARIANGLASNGVGMEEKKVTRKRKAADSGNGSTSTLTKIIAASFVPPNITEGLKPSNMDQHNVMMEGAEKIVEVVQNRPAYNLASDDDGDDFDD